MANPEEKKETSTPVETGAATPEEVKAPATATAENAGPTVAEGQTSVQGAEKVSTEAQAESDTAAGPGTIADDIRPYTEEGKKTQEFSYIDEAIPGKDHMRHYSGELGTFDYDDRQFQLQLMEKAADKNGDKVSAEVIRYIGADTDGSKIKIPDGVKNADFMFMGSNIKSAPSLPVSVESAQATFADCHQLKSAKISVPPACKNTAFMFSNCENLEKGPRSIPSTCNTMDYMFAGCASMKHTPNINHGVKSMNGAFIECRSLKDAPNVPKSVVQANNATWGCQGIDKAKDEKANREREKARQKLEKKLDRPTLSSKIGSMFSAVMQVHAMRKMGYGIVAAPMMAHMMRQQGTFTRDFRGGIGAVALSHGGAMGRLVYQSNMTKSHENAEKAAARKQEKLAQFDRLYGQGSAYNRQTKAMAAKGSRDQKNGLFLRVLDMETLEKNIYRESHGNESVYKAHEDMFASSYGGVLGEADKKNVAKWYKEQLAEKAAYFSEAEQAIKTDKRYSASQREDAMRGLDEMREVSLDPMIESMSRVQGKFQIFNDGDQRDIDKMMIHVYGKSVFGTDQQRQRQNEGPQSTIDGVFTPAPERRSEPEATQPQSGAAAPTPEAGATGGGNSQRIYGEGHQPAAAPGSAGMNLSQITAQRRKDAENMLGRVVSESSDKSSEREVGA